MICGSHSSLPVELSRHMLFGRILLSSLSIKVLAVCAAWHLIVVPEQTATSELGKQEVDDVFERLWKQGVCLRSVSRMCRGHSSYREHIRS